MPDELSHYGTPRHSGRYKWGSGEDPEQRNKSFLGTVEELKKKGMSEVDIAKGMKMTTTQLRARKSVAKSDLRRADFDQAARLKEKGMSNVAIGERMGGINESSVRALLNPSIQQRSELAMSTANMLKAAVEDKKFIDVGIGVERHMNINRTKLNTAISMLEDDGYKVWYVPIEQLGTGKNTSIKVLAKADINYTEDLYKHKDKIRLITDHSEDGGRTFVGLEPIQTVSSKRIQIRYHEDGGTDKDGVIELRRGVSDISLGNSKYAQVRIGVDGTHYLKGMAMYSDDLPAGVDIMFNTNKKKDTPKMDVLKEMKKYKEGDLKGEIDPDNPFGAIVRQKHYITDQGLKNKNSAEMLELKTSGISYSDIAKKFKLSEEVVKSCVTVRALNIVNEEGEWQDKWSTTLSSQMLSKQRPALAEKQLARTYNVKKEEHDEIMSLTNPAIKKKLLDSFSDDCDSAAVHLKAAALPRTGWHVLLPIPKMKETEVYAPNFRDGEKVVLIRYPHGGLFEIPELTVNNRNAIAKKALDDAKDAIGIHPKVAEKLSGADFDGDAVLVIPNDSRSVKTAKSLKDLVDFDPKASYPEYEGMQRMTVKMKPRQMGDISNLITDMTIKGANNDELARAVKHSMVVIDAEKHKLNYKQSAIDNNISGLKMRYQGGPTRGASTLLSRSKSQQPVYDREAGKKIINPLTGKPRRVYIDPDTGKKLYEYTDESYTNKSGKIIRRTIQSTKMAEADDAHTLSSGTPIETIYANHANQLKALGNQSRKESLKIAPTEYSPSAKKVYEKEVRSLNSKLNIALKNAPLERQAQLLANATVAAKKAANPDMDSAEIKKLKGVELAIARSRTGAKKDPVEIEDREWEAIQAGAISNSLLTKILNNTDIDKVKALATPRAQLEISQVKQSRAKQMLAKGNTQAEVADALGLSISTISKLMD